MAAAIWAGPIELPAVGWKPVLRNGIIVPTRRGFPLEDGLPQPPARLLVRAIFTPLLALLLHPCALPSAGATLPDSVLASVGDRQVTASEYRRQWDRVGLSIVSAEDPAEKQKLEFLEQLINAMRFSFEFALLGK